VIDGMCFLRRLRSSQPDRANLARSWYVLWPCVMAIVVLGAASCRSPQPTLYTVSYDDLNRPIPIATRGRAQAPQLISFFMATNPHIGPSLVNEIAEAYIEEAAEEGINSDVAFCQMCLETNYLRFGGDVKAWQNNFCGLGATGGGEPGLSFASLRLGVRAHIQHLKAYANAQSLRKKRVDPRFTLVRRGKAPFVEDLTGAWATDPAYGAKIKRKLQTLDKHL